MFKKTIFCFLAIFVLVACEKNEEFNEVIIENINTVSANINENVLLIHNNKLKRTNGLEGMDYDSITGIFSLSMISAEEAGYFLKESQILSVDMDTTALLRRITKIDTIGDLIHIKTESASLEEVFRDADFELVSEFDENILVKSGSTDEEISRALFNGKQVKPARVITHTSEGTFIQSVFEEDKLKSTSSVNGEEKKTISFDYSFNGAKIYHYEDSRGKVDIDVTGGKIKLETEFVLATAIRWNKLKAFRFEVKPSATVFAKTKLTATANYNKSGEKTLKSKVYSKTYIYALGGIVLSVKIDCDIVAGYDFKSDASLVASSGIYATMAADLGARYASGTWSPIASFSHAEGFYPLDYTAKANASLRVEIFPRATAYICGVNGIGLDIVPFIRNTVAVTSTNGNQSFSAGMYYGLDARVRASVGLLGKTLATYNSGNIKIVGEKKVN